MQKPRKNKNRTSHWRAVIRIKGYPTVCNHFDRKQEAVDWAADVERQIKHGEFNFYQLTTGARQGEIMGLEWRHVDFENQLANPKETKNGRPRSISLAASVIAELSHLYQKRNPTKPLVFASKTAFGQVDLKKAWQEALKRAQIENCRVHDMRHTFCTLATRQGASNLELATASLNQSIRRLNSGK